MKLIVGLGNIGSQYENTRHNVGFMFVDYLRDEWNIHKFNSKNNGDFAKGKTPLGEDVVLLKPTTYMNLSGEAVLSFCSFFKVKPEDVIVIQDEIDLSFGEVRDKVGGGSAGHNGIKSIDEKIGKTYRRVRIGVGHPRDLPEPQNRMDVADYVLGKFTLKETIKMKKIFEKTMEVLDLK